MKQGLLSGIAVLVALAVLTQTALACGDPPAHAVAGPKAQLVIQGRAASVRIGEAIFANLILPKDSQLPTGTLDRASCTSLEFTVEPANGWHDPWADWYYSGISQHATGRDGPRTCGVVGYPRGAEIPPPQINFTLNDWIEFDSPGKYRISATYRTEFRKRQDIWDDPYDDRKTAVQVTLATDAVEVEVLPESASVADRTSDALALLRAHFRDGDPWWGSPDPEPFPVWTQYSHSEAVIPLLAQFYEQNSNVARRGLITSPHRKLVVDAMEKELVDPQHSVDFNFLAELAFIAAEVQHPELFGGSSEEWWSPEWERQSKKRSGVFLQLLAEYTRKLLSSLPQKHEYPRRDGLSAALMVLARWDLPGKDQLRKQAADVTARLMPKMKEAPNLWEEEWKVIASPALLPYLRKTEGFQQMRWLYKLAPQEARRSMIHSAARDDWATVAGWAAIMSENEKPSAVLDSHLARALRQEQNAETEDNVEQVLLKLGGTSLIAPVRQILGSESCVGSPVLWGFWLKQQGQLAEETLVRRYHQDGADPTCSADLNLQQVWINHSVRYWSPQIEAIVVSELDKSDPIATDAAHLLERFGSKDSEPALWTKLEKWHRSPPFRTRDSTQSISPEKDLEAVLLSALLNGRSWLPEPQRIDRLRQLCVYRCDSLKWARTTDQIQHFPVWELNEGDPHFGDLTNSFNDFKAWIQRFPAGTSFEVTALPGNAPLTESELDARYSDLGALMRELKLKIVNVLPYDEYGRCLDSRPNGRSETSQDGNFGLPLVVY